MNTHLKSGALELTVNQLRSTLLNNIIGHVGELANIIGNVGETSTTHILLITARGQHRWPCW